MFVGIYRPPPSTKNKLTIPMFMEDFPDLLDSYASEKQQVVFLGNINFHYDSTTDNYVKTLKAMLNERNLQQVVDQPTHKNKHILDWLIKRDDDDSVNAIEVFDKALSDHFLVYFNILNASIPAEIKTVTSRKLKEIKSPTTLPGHEINSDLTR